MSLSNIIKGSSTKSNSPYILSELYFTESMMVRKYETNQTDKENEDLFYIKNESEMLYKKAEEEALRIMEEAELKADKILLDARRSADEAYQEAVLKGQKEGFSKGIKEGNNESRERLHGMVEELTALSNSLVSEKQEIVKSGQKYITEIAVEVARKVVGESFVKGEEAFYTIMEKAINQMPPAEKLTVTISGKDFPLRTYDAARIQKLAKDFTNIEIQCVNSEESGTLKLETSIMMIDASLNTQFGLLKKELMESIGAD